MSADVGGFGHWGPVSAQSLPRSKRAVGSLLLSRESRSGHQTLGCASSTFTDLTPHGSGERVGPKQRSADRRPALGGWRSQSALAQPSDREALDAPLDTSSPEPRLGGREQRTEGSLEGRAGPLAAGTAGARRRAGVGGRQADENRLVAQRAAGYWAAACLR